MSKSPYGNISRMNVEWSSKGRKEENALRGLNHTADREAIAEQLAELTEDRIIDESYEILEEVLSDGLPANVTFNGSDYAWPEVDWWNEGDGFDDYDPYEMDWLDAQFFDDPA